MGGLLHHPLINSVQSLPEQSQVTLRVYNVIGQEVATVTEGIQNAGYRETEWDPGEVASGVYLYRIEARSASSDQVFVRSKKMLLIR